MQLITHTASWIYTMPSIKSIVVFDLETTGRPRDEHNMTKITELALIACEREHCFNEEFPRFLNKLVLGVNPFKRISEGATEASGLTNELLENAKPFNAEMVDLVTIFLNRLPKPICIIAHNGNGFDFPIFRRQLIKCNAVFPEDIFCADSYEFFTQLFPRDGRISSKFETKEEDGNCAKKDEIILGTPPSKPSMQAINEKTPESKIIRNYNYDNSGKIPEAKRRLDLEDGNDNDVANACKIMRQTRPVSYSLSNIFTFLHGRSFQNAHRAEADCFALLSCILKCNKEFFEWIDRNSKLLSEIEPMF